VRISDFEALTFDCYGTLIDWETGIAEHLIAWADRHQIVTSRQSLLEAFAEAEAQVEAASPAALYRDVLRAVHGKLADHLATTPDASEADAFADSVGDWPAFGDTVPALQVLRKRYRLVVVSNIDRYSFNRTLAKLSVRLDGLVIAEDVGAYKPDLRMFEAALGALAEMGIQRNRVLHVAQSLFHDHEPAKKMGLKTVWINRRRGGNGWGATKPPRAAVTPDVEVGSLYELVELDDRQRSHRVTGPPH